MRFTGTEGPTCVYVLTAISCLISDKDKGCFPDVRWWSFLELDEGNRMLNTGGLGLWVAASLDRIGYVPVTTTTQNAALSRGGIFPLATACNRTYTETTSEFFILPHSIFNPSSLIQFPQAVDVSGICSKYQRCGFFVEMRMP